MLIPSDILGLSLPERVVEADWRRTTNFSAAVGDDDPRFLDDSREGGLQVHPVFPVVLSWPIVTSLPGLLGDRVAPEVFSRMVHATERIRYERPLLPGDALVMTGRVAGLSQTRAGALVTVRVEVTGSAGRPVYTEELGGLFRGVQAEGAPAEGALGDGWDQPLDPDAGWELELPIPKGAAFVYDGCTDIVFPIHTSRAFARAVGLDEPPLQGTCSLAMAVGAILAREAGGDPARLRALFCSFRRPVLPGTSARLQVRKAEGDGIRFRLLNHEGRVALRDGEVELADRGQKT